MHTENNGLLRSLNEQVQINTDRLSLLEKELVGHLSKINEHTSQIADAITRLSESNEALVHIAAGRFHVHGGIVILLLVFIASFSLVDKAVQSGKAVSVGAHGVEVK